MLTTIWYVFILPDACTVFHSGSANVSINNVKIVNLQNSIV